MSLPSPDIQTPLTPIHRPPFQPRKYTVDEYRRLHDSGILAEDERVELIEGDVIVMSPVGRRHVVCVNRLNMLLALHVGLEGIVQVQSPLQLSDLSLPEPDLIVLTRRPDFYRDDPLPGPREVLLIVEVADTSVRYDREVKLPLYARHGYPEFWLVNLPDSQVEQYRVPTPEGYRSRRVIGLEDQLQTELIRPLAVSARDILG
jgi:Uma2 family endonuclease